MTYGTCHCDLTQRRPNLLPLLRDLDRSRALESPLEGFHPSDPHPNPSDSEAVLQAALLACMAARGAAGEAFRKWGRAMTAADVIPMLGPALLRVAEEA